MLTNKEGTLSIEASRIKSLGIAKWVTFWAEDPDSKRETHVVYGIIKSGGGCFVFGRFDSLDEAEGYLKELKKEM